MKMRSGWEMTGIMETVSIILAAVDARLCYFKEQGDSKPSTAGIAYW